jgi:hypothetical protein
MLYMILAEEQSQELVSAPASVPVVITGASTVAPRRFAVVSAVSQARLAFAGQQAAEMYDINQHKCPTKPTQLLH